jgi:hypothetical protein
VTLVLGTCLPRAVVLGADSKTERWKIDETTGAVLGIDFIVDRKLFKLSRAGVATYGSGPAGEKVPAVLTKELQPEWSVSEVIQFLQKRFRGADEMGALVGGLDDRGDPCLFDVRMSGADPQPIVPPQLVLRGLRNQLHDQLTPATPASVLAQMLELLRESTGPHVGPPYEFLVLTRGWTAPSV